MPDDNNRSSVSTERGETGPHIGPTTQDDGSSDVAPRGDSGPHIAANTQDAASGNIAPRGDSGPHIAAKRKPASGETEAQSRAARAASGAAKAGE